MRYKKIFSAVALATILSLLAIGLAASPAMAADPEIEADPDSGEIGDSIDVDGRDFRANDQPEDDYRISLYFTDEELDVGDDIDDFDNYRKVKSSKATDEDGDFSTSFTVPDVIYEDADNDKDETEVTGGTYYVYCTYKNDDEIEALAEFTVIAPEVSASPDSGIVGEEIDLEGQHFEGNDDLTVKFGGDSVDIESGDTSAESDGSFDLTIEVPEVVAGEHTITVEDENDHTGEVTFTVEAALSASPDSGRIAELVTVSGTGFGASQDVSITFNGAQVATADTDSDGSFTATFTVPQVEAGTYDIEAEDDDGNSATASFTMSSSVSLGTGTSEGSPGYVGQEMTMSGNGFLPDTTVTITYTSSPIVVATTQTDSAGDFSATFTIPASEAGAHTITASDGTNSLSESFYMESSAPAIPQPLLPEMGVKAKQPVYFDWADVADSSGVTYTLQIATDENFATVVLTKPDLVASEYTLTEAEKLENRDAEAPYYWRVRAIDGAYNASGWTGAGNFAVGGIFSNILGNRPSLIHLWWGLGAAGAGIGGYFLGKRRAYYY